MASAEVVGTMVLLDGQVNAVGRRTGYTVTQGTKEAVWALIDTQQIIAFFTVDGTEVQLKAGIVKGLEFKPAKASEKAT